MSDRLPVGIDVSAIPADPRGAGRYVIELVAALDRRRRVGVRLQARRSDGGRWSEVAPGADVSAVVPDSRGARLAWEQVIGPRVADRWGVRVFHGPHYTMPEAARVPKVVTVHDLTFFDHPEWHERVKVPLFRRAVRVAARHADGIVCVSDATRRRLVELLDPQCPVHVAPHGVDHDTFSPDPPGDGDAERLAALGVRRPYVAFVGTLEPRKDVATLVRAFDLLAPGRPDLALVIAGGEGWGNGAFDDAVNASPFRTRIVRTGYVPEPSLPSLLRSATAVVYPALEEGFGLPAVEALACGAPVVTTAGSVMEELTGEAAYTAPPRDPEALAAVLAPLVDGVASPERRAAGLEVARRYTWDASAATHEDVYLAAAEAAARRR